MNRLLIFRGILQDEIIGSFCNLHYIKDRSEYNKRYYELCYLLTKQQKHSIREYILDKMFDDENVFSLGAEKSMAIDEKIKQAVLRDILILQSVMNMDYQALCVKAEDTANFLMDDKQIKRIKKFALSDVENVYQQLFSAYENHGVGQYRNLAFTMNKKATLLGVENFAPLGFDYLYGYDQQKQELIANTLRFVSGKQAHNVLLFGERGTGKSAGVKALVEKFGKSHKLRMVQVDKSQLNMIPALIEKLSKRGLWFIIFIDDLTFEIGDEGYKMFKSIIQGGINEQGVNVLFCVTTNRRSMIKDDTVMRQNDVSVNDHLNETAALVDRFGLKLYYQRPNKQQFEQMVMHLADKYGMKDMQSQLKQACQYAMFNGGYNGRSAALFVDSKR